MVAHSGAPSRGEIAQRRPRREIERDGDLVVRDQPVAVDLPESGRGTKPHIGRGPVLHRPADPVEAVGECHIVADGDREVVNLVAERPLV